MKEKEIVKIINKIKNTEDSKLMGVIISYLSYYYLDMFDITEKEFYAAIKKSIKMIREDNKE